MTDQRTLKESKTFTISSNANNKWILQQNRSQLMINALDTIDFFIIWPGLSQKMIE